jgi:hypothetical protein
VVADVRHAGEDDLLLALERRVVEVEVEAAALERLAQLTGVVRGQEHERDLGRRDRAELGDRDLVVGEDLEEQRLGLDLDAVDLVDQQDDRLGRGDRLEQRTGEQELVREDVLLDLLPLARAALLHDALGLDAQELLLVVPLVERLRLVEALVALEADEARAGHAGDALGQLGLSGAGGAFDEHRLAESVGEVHDARDPLVGEIGDALQGLADGRDRLEAGRCHFQTLTFVLTGRSSLSEAPDPLSNTSTGSDAHECAKADRPAVLRRGSGRLR